MFLECFHFTEHESVHFSLDFAKRKVFYNIESNSLYL